MTNEKHRKELIMLRWACRWVIIGSALFSVWANVLHAGTFEVVTWIFAAAPPVVVLIGWEMVSRIPIFQEAPWYRRFVRPLVTLAIFAGGAWLSYWHQVDAIGRYTTDTEAAHILPALVDGLMVIASVSVYELNAHLRDVEARIAGIAVRTSSRKPEAPKDAKNPLAKEKIAQILAKSPGLAPVDVAKLAGTSYNYAYKVINELKKEAEPQLA
jgi:hypothetical protein